MAVEDVLDERKPKPGSALRAAVGHVNAVKSLGEPRQMLGRNARPIVAYRHARLAFTGFARRQRHVEAFAGSRVFEPVLDQILKYALEFGAIAEHDQALRRHGHLDLDAFVARERLQAVDGLANERNQIDLLVGAQMRVELDARE